MLTARENMIKVIRGGCPERYVNQYEALVLLEHPYCGHQIKCLKGEFNIKNEWGVVHSYPLSQPSSYPVHTPDAIVIKDIENWRDYVKAPSLSFSDEEWEKYRKIYAEVDRSKAFAAAIVAPGLFEQCHHLCSMPEALMNFIMYPEEMHELIRFLTDWELELAEGICSNLHPDAIFHHDDWGGEISTFLSPDMFAEFFLEPYKEIYGYYHSHGVELIVHHSDSYAATLVPYMIEMGIDVWQGVMDSNNIPDLLCKYGDKISFMGGIDNKFVDHENWTEEECSDVVRKVCSRCENKHFIPCITQGMPGSVYPNVYQAVSEAIDKHNCSLYGLHDMEKFRLPLQV